MVKRVVGVLVLLLALGALPAEARWWVGGGVGLSFGSDTTFVSVEPVAGYSVTERTDVGARLIFRYRDDDRVPGGFSATDYGGALFVRYFPTRIVFLQAEYEYLSYEFPAFGGGSDREGFNSLLGGAGLSQPIGSNARFFVLGLYNFSFEENERSPYSDAWVLRAGVGFHF